MKMTKKIIALILAVTFVFSAVCVSVLANSIGDSAIESPIIPTHGESWYKYEYDDEEKTAVMTGFTYQDGRNKVTIRASVLKDDVSYAVVGVADNVFKDTKIQSLTVENGVKSIGAAAFKNCTSLSSVTIADSVTSIASDAFEGTKWFDEQADGVVYAGKVAYKAKGTLPATVTLASGTVSVSDGAFAGQTSLEKVIFPEATTIGAGAFEGCTNVKFYCYENSPAHLYATANSIDVVFIPSLQLISAPTKLEYYQNDALNLDGLELLYVSETGETDVSVTEGMITGFDSAVLGKQTVVITYETLQVNFEVTVIERPAFIPGDVDGNGELEIADAIHLLFHINFEDDEDYAVNQPVDFDGNGELEIADAIYLLYHVNFEDDYPLH